MKLRFPNYLGRYEETKTITVAIAMLSKQDGRTNQKTKEKEDNGTVTPFPRYCRVYLRDNILWRAFYHWAPSSTVFEENGKAEGSIFVSLEEVRGASGGCDGP
jgi:hypothetical protein